MAGSERSETSLIIEKTKLELTKTLRESWKSLYWEPEIETPRGSGIAVLIEATDDKSEIVYMFPTGKIIRANKDSLEEVDLPAYLTLAPKAENILKALKLEQRREIDENPGGRDILWRPGQTRFGKWYCSSSSRDTVITVRAKRDGLYCPNHPDMKLITVVAHSEDRERFSDCPVKGCFFSVYNGI